jgi:hypothetical protein
MSQSQHNGSGKFFDELPKSVQQIIESVYIADGEYCPCCGRRKPTKNIKSHLDRPGSWIPRSRVLFIFEEIVRRIGFAEATREIPYNRSSLRRLINGDKPYVRKSTVEKAMVLLRELREGDIVYSRNDILYGSKARGLEPKPPQDAKEYYKRHGDGDTEYRRKFRDEQKKREEELERLAGY